MIRAALESPRLAYLPVRDPMPIYQQVDSYSVVDVVDSDPSIANLDTKPAETKVGTEA